MGSFNISGDTQRDPGDGIVHRYPLLIHEIVEEKAYRLQVAGDRLRRSSLPEQMIHAGEQGDAA